MSDARTYEQLSALCAQMAAALESIRVFIETEGKQLNNFNGNPPVQRVLNCVAYANVTAESALTAYRTLSPSQWQRVPEGCVVVPVDLLGEVVGTLQALDAQTPTKACQSTIVKIYELVERARREV